MFECSPAGKVVTPAKAGIYSSTGSGARWVDPGLRRDDNQTCRTHRKRSARNAYDARGDVGRVAQRLQYDAVALGEFQQRVDPVLRLLGVEFEGEADRAKADRRSAIHPQGAAEVEVALG